MNKFTLTLTCLGLLFLIIFFSSCEVNGQSALQRETESKQKCAETCKTACASPQIAKNIYEIFEDSDGIIWFGTYEKGVAKYDGKTLKYISETDGICGNTVADMAQDNDGNIWFGTYRDMCVYDPNGSSKESEMSFSYFEKTGDVPHLGHGWKSVKTDPNGNIWVNSHHGIFQYVNGEFKEFQLAVHSEPQGSFCNTPGGVSFDLTDSKGNMWFGTDHDGAYKYDGKSFTHYTKKDGLSGNSVMGIAEDKNGNIWFVCRENIGSGENDGGATMFDGSTFHHFNSEKGLFKNDLNTIYSDKSGNIWIGATGVGVYKHDGQEFTLYTEPEEVDLSNNFSINGLQSMLEDSKGNYWFGFSGGLFKLIDGKLVNMTKSMLEC